MREIKRNGTKNLPSISTARCGTKEFRYSSNKAQNKRDLRFQRPKSYKKYDHSLNMLIIIFLLILL